MDGSSYLPLAKIHGTAQAFDGAEENLEDSARV